MKALDNRNATARKKANGQPYYKAVVEYIRACPDCDVKLAMDRNNVYQCECSAWIPRWDRNSMAYDREPKTKRKGE